MSAHSDYRKFERLIGSFSGNCEYDRTLESEGRHQADLQQRSKIQNDISGDIELVLIGTVTRNLGTGETIIEMDSEFVGKSDEI